jgi:hypothetical protein
MSQGKVPALAGLLRQCGFSWAAADEITSALDRVPRQGCSSDDLAGALFNWRRGQVNAALGRARSRARDTLRGDGTDHNVENILAGVVDETDVEGQIALFDTTDERMRRGTPFPGDENASG